MSSDDAPKRRKANVVGERRLELTPAERVVGDVSVAAAVLATDTETVQRRARDAPTASRDEVRALMSATEALTVRVKDLMARLESVENLLLPQTHAMAREIVALQRRVAGPYDTPYAAAAIFSTNSLSGLESKGKATKAAAAAAVALGRR